MSDRINALEKVHQTQLENLYTAFYSAITTANGNDDIMQQAEERLIAGIAHAESIRERALRSLDQI